MRSKRSSRSNRFRILPNGLNALNGAQRLNGLNQPERGGSLKRIAAIEDPPVIVKILAHLGLPTRAPPRSPAQRFDLFQTI